MNSAIDKASPLKDFIDELSDAIVLWSADGRIAHVNRRATELLGWTAADMAGQDIDQLWSSSNGGVPVRGTVCGELQTADGVLFIGLVEDGTTEPRLQHGDIGRRDALQKMSQLMTVREMAEAIAHELNQPLAAINNYAGAAARLLSAAEPQSDDVRKSLSNVELQTQRAGEIVNRLRNFGRYESFNPEPVLPDELLGNLLRVAGHDAASGNVELDIDVADGLPAVFIDRAQIEQVFLNLIRNAIDAMGDSGAERRVLAIRCVPDPPGHVRFEVSDSGLGVPESLEAQLFDAFVTTKPEGLGMGLAVCRKIVQSHGGTIEFRNNADAGATFCFTIPAEYE